MSKIDVKKDLDDLTVTVVADLDAPVERAWELWADPRKLERWWGPPSYPATVTQHDLTPGGEVRYFMTGPEGDKPAGGWRVTEVDPPKSLALIDEFQDADGNPQPDMPQTQMQVRLAPRASGGTTMTVTSRFPSREAMSQLMDMGMEDGIKEAMGQIDGVLAS